MRFLLHLLADIIHLLFVSFLISLAIISSTMVNSSGLVQSLREKQNLGLWKKKKKFTLERALSKMI